MIPLIVRSHFSLMRGTASIPDLCRTAGELGYRRLALTDTDNLYGLWPFLKYCRLNGLEPIVGAEVTDKDSPRRAVCLAEDDEGYRNLCRLLTRRKQDDDFSLAASLPAYSRGLLVLTADADLLEIWRDAGVDLAATLSRRPDAEADAARKAARRLGLLACAAPDSWFLQPDDFALHRVLRAIHRNTAVSRLTPSDLAPADAWLASPDEYRKRFDIWPEAVEATEALAERIAFAGPSQNAVMPPWEDPLGRAADAVLRQTAYDGARAIYGDDLSEAVVERLEHELSLIGRKNFSGYFLVVRDIIRRSPRICGRGSGAASLVAYCLGITNVCPIKHNLYFERFINEERVDPPDIDVDFAWDERDGVIEAVLRQYPGRSAMVCNHVVFQPRMAIRETAKVYGLMDREIGQVSKRLPWFWKLDSAGGDIEARLKAMPETRSLDFPEPWPEILRMAQRLVGIPRNLSVHPGGIILTPRPIDEYAPIETAPKGVPIVQWEKDGCEDAGLVKIDLLGNRSLGVIRDALAMVRENVPAFDETRWEPEDDGPTQAAVARGETMGCFYIESPAMRLLQKKAGVGDFEHLVIHSSIIRPAANDYIQDYLARLKGAPWEPIHPLLADILDDTFGIMVYQEDVSRAAVALAGFSHAEADRLRKILTKKDKELALKSFRERFFDGARNRGVTDDQARAVWNMMLSFDGYSFCKPHSASYARVSFQAAYLKTHFPAEFMAGVIGNQGGFYSTFAYVSEARRLGLAILPPDVNESRVRWTGRGDELRVGLMSVKDLADKTMHKIVDARRDEPYRDFSDFRSRVKPDEAETRALIHAGALDSLDPGAERTRLLWEIVHEKYFAASAASARDDRLFDFDLNLSPPPLPEAASPDGYLLERLRQEYKVLGFLTDRHPMVLFEQALRGGKLIKAVDLPRYAGRRVRLAGWLITGRLVHTKHGDPMEFLTFEDDTACVETTFFPRAYRRFCEILDYGRPYVLSGKVEENFGAVTLAVDHAARF